MITIIGVDFSGAIERTNNINTWMSKGNLDAAGALTLSEARPIRRHDLCKLLINIPAPAVVAMDFPFGVPKAFAEAEFQIKGALMPEMWQVIAALDDLPQYIQQIRPRLRREGDLQRFNKCHRHWETVHYPGVALSPLNPAFPDMFPMTFHGMKMMHTLWEQSDCKVPPLDGAGRNGAVLLETMPGAVLSHFGFEPSVYKRYKNSADAPRLRRKITDALPAKSGEFGVRLENLGRFYDLCIESHDCLDAVVAAITAAIWATDETLFHRPEAHQDPTILADARREGCIYAPRKPGG